MQDLNKTEKINAFSEKSKKLITDMGNAEILELCETSFKVTSSKRTSPMVPNMELPSGNECTTKPRKCCRKLANPIMVGTKPFWKNGTRTANTATLCQNFG